MRLKDVIAGSVVAVLAGCCSPRPPTPYSLEEVLTAVKSAYLRAATSIHHAPPAANEPKLILNQAVVTLQTANTYSAGGGVDVVVVSISGEVARTRSQSISVTFAKPEEKDMVVEVRSLEDDLVKAIRAAANAAATALKVGGPGGLPVKSIDCTVSFEVTKSGNLELKVPIGGITVGPSGSASSTASQQIELSFSTAK